MLATHIRYLLRFSAALPLGVAARYYALSCDYTAAAIFMHGREAGSQAHGNPRRELSRESDRLFSCEPREMLASCRGGLLSVSKHLLSRPPLEAKGHEKIVGEDGVPGSNRSQ